MNKKIKIKFKQIWYISLFNETLSIIIKRKRKHLLSSFQKIKQIEKMQSLSEPSTGGVLIKKQTMIKKNTQEIAKVYNLD